MGDFLSQAGSKVANVVFIYTLLRNSMPSQVWNYVDYYIDRMKSWFDKDMSIIFEEFPYSDSGYCGRSQVYKNVEAYLRDPVLLYARGLKAKPGSGTEPIDLSMDDYGTVSDEFNGIKLKWYLDKKVCESKGMYSRLEAKRSYILTFDRRHRSVILGQYMHNVNQEGERIRKKNKFQKIYNNSKEDEGSWGYNSFDHPATFDTLGMDPIKKQKIINDLDAFTKGEEYYKKIGKAWKRGYLLYGPPGTGKSTMIAAMANYLHYDVYMVELTAIRDNTELKRLLDETSKKSLIVIEDIDCSIDLTGKRAEKKQQEPNKESENGTAEKGGKKEESSRARPNKLTLSGVLNCIDGLSSGCYKERIFVFTTNHLEKLDPALIRRGRMDLHVEMSYCCFESFKVLAKNYQNLDWHPWFEKVRVLLEEVNIAPADVAENLMPKCPGLDNDGEVALESLISALEQAKEAARLKAEEEQRNQLLAKKSSDGDGDHDKKEQEQAVADENESIDHNDEALDEHDESSDHSDDDDDEEEEEKY